MGSQDNNNTESLEVYMFGVRLNESVATKNAHKQLYEALNALDNEWYQPKSENERVIQFVQRQQALLCRSNVKPVGIKSTCDQIKVNDGETLRIKVRLPVLRREMINQSFKTRLTPESEKEEFYTKVLQGHGMSVELMAWTNNKDSTILIQKNKSKVFVPVDDVSAIVKVTDAKKFIKAMKLGVGRYRTYGCGLIQLVER